MHTFGGLYSAYHTPPPPLRKLVFLLWVPSPKLTHHANSLPQFLDLSNPPFLLLLADLQPLC